MCTTGCGPGTAWNSSVIVARSTRLRLRRAHQGHARLSDRSRAISSDNQCRPFDSRVIGEESCRRLVGAMCAVRSRLADELVIDRQSRAASRTGTALAVAASVLMLRNEAPLCVSRPPRRRHDSGHRLTGSHLSDNRTGRTARYRVRNEENSLVEATMRMPDKEINRVALPSFLMCPPQLGRRPLSPITTVAAPRQAPPARRPIDGVTVGTTPSLGVAAVPERAVRRLVTARCPCCA
jgi:hypothetical protein